MFKVTNKDPQNDVMDVPLKSLTLTLNIVKTFSRAFILTFGS